MYSGDKMHKPYEDLKALKDTSANSEDPDIMQNFAAFH